MYPFYDNEPIGDARFDPNLDSNRTILQVLINSPKIIFALKNNVEYQKRGNKFSENWSGQNESSSLK